MTIKNFWKSNLLKVVLLLMAFIVIVGFAYVLFDWGYRFKMRTLFLRGSYMAIAVIWAVGSIWWICYRVRFGRLWRGMIDEILPSQDSFERETSQKYQVLVSKYPHATARYESECWKKTPRPTNLEIMDNALHISDEEWQEREAVAEERLRSRHK